MSARDKFLAPMTIKCQWCGNQKVCKNNAQLEHFKRCYPGGRTFIDEKNNKQLRAASGMDEKVPDCVVLCFRCVPLAKEYMRLCWEEEQAYLAWWRDFNI